MDFSEMHESMFFFFCLRTGNNDHRGSVTHFLDIPKPKCLLTVFCFLVCVPDGGPCFNVDDDGCIGRRTVGDGAPKGNEATD